MSATRKPNTGNSDCDLWVQETFQRRTVRSQLEGRDVQQLVIKNLNGKSETVLSEEQLSGLIYFLRTKFCGACHGTGFDPDTLNGVCEYCSEQAF